MINCNKYKKCKYPELLLLAVILLGGSDSVDELSFSNNRFLVTVDGA